MTVAPQISRGALVTACDLFGYLKTNAELESLLLEYELEESVPARGSLEKTALSLKEFAIRNPDLHLNTDYGQRELREVIVNEAIRRVRWNSQSATVWEKLERYLGLDGLAFSTLPSEEWSDYPKVVGLVASMPTYVELPATMSELEILLQCFQLTIASRHLQSAKENVAQGDWEATNSQCRTFLDAVTDGIANALFAADASHRTSGLQKRQLLAEKGFLSKEKHEFGDGGGQTFLPGLGKLLHTDGAHPGTSTQHDALFRLQVVVVTARWLLKRLKLGPLPRE